MELKQEQYEAEVVEDARTGEIIPRGAPPELKPGILAQININQVGTLEVGEEELKVLQEPLDPKDVQIRPDGLVYLPWTWYANRLNRAFGILKWGLIPQGSPMIKDMGNNTLIVWLNWLVIKGVPVSMAGGETSYQPSNYTMSYGDAVEGARSNSLARNCKMLGMSLELWDAEWVSNWRKEHAEQYTNEKNKKVWRKRKTNGQKPKVVTEKQGEKVELVETVVGYVSKEVWDQHAKQIAEDADQSKPTSPNGEKKYTLKALKDVKTFNQIAEDSGKTKKEVAEFLGKLDKDSSYSFSWVVEQLMIGGENA